MDVLSLDVLSMDVLSLDVLSMDVFSPPESCLEMASSLDTRELLLCLKKFTEGKSV
jgi:hypothetical protein